MPDERDDELEPKGPHRPDTVRHPQYRQLTPRPEGLSEQQQAVQRPRENAPTGQDAAAPAHFASAARETGEATNTPSADPRFARAPITPAEMKALHQAPHADAACQLLGQMQEARLSDGRLPPSAAPTHKSPPVIDTYMSLHEQIALGLRPTPQQLAHLQSAPTPDEKKARTTEFLAQRKAQNAALFERSRRWGPELDRQAHAADQKPPEERIASPQGLQAWRSELSELRTQAYRGDSPPLSGPTTAPKYQELSRDPRFDAGPINPEEMQALHHAATPEAARQLLGQMQETRLKDGRLPQTSNPHPEKAEINQALTLKEQIQLALRPTAQELAYLQAGAMQGQEHARTMAFIAERQTHNAYWRERAREWSPEAQRAARTEQTEGRRNQQEKSARAQRLREARIERHLAERADRGRDSGGRDR